MLDVKPRQIWEIDRRPVRIMNVLGDEVEIQYRDQPDAATDLARTQTFSAKAMLGDRGRFVQLRKAHEFKTKDELTELIRMKIADQPVCPTGMSVVVRGIGGGAWAVDANPPRGSTIAHADCVNYIHRIVQELRGTYDLA